MSIFFYLIFGLAIFFRNKKVLYLMTGLFLIATIINLTGIIDAFKDNLLMYFLFSKYNCEFIMGCVTAYLFNKHNQLLYNYRHYKLVFGALLFIVTWLLAYNQLIQKGSSVSVICFGIASSLIILGAALSKIQIKKFDFFVYLGTSSYSIYLIHVPLQAIAYKLFNQYFTGNTQINIFVGGVIIVSVIAGCVLHTYFEAPLLEFLRNYNNSKGKLRDRLTVSVKDT